MAGNNLGVIFDLDGVLWNTSKIHESSFYKMFAEFGIQVQFEYESIAGMSTKEAINKIISKQMPGMQKLNIQELAFVKQEIAHRAIKKSMPVFSDTFNLLRGLKKKKIGYAIASSTSAKNLQLFINYLGKHHLEPEVYISGDDVKKAKPDPEIYEKAKELMSQKFTHLIVVEDSQNGINAGLSAGCEVIGICSGQHKIEGTQSLLGLAKDRVQLLEMLITHRNRL